MTDDKILYLHKAGQNKELDVVIDAGRQLSRQAYSEMIAHGRPAEEALSALFIAAYLLAEANDLTGEFQQLAFNYCQMIAEADAQANDLEADEEE